MTKRSDAPADRAGMLGVVESGHLRRLIEESKRVRGFRPSEFDRELLRIAQAAVATKVPTALVLPLPGTNTGALLAASMLVAHFAVSKTLTAQVAIATRQLRLRGFYDTLYCQDEQLCEYFPRTVVGPDGAVADVGERDVELRTRPGRLHFSSELSRFAGVAPKLHGIVVEAGASVAEDAERFLARFGGRIPLVYLTADPNDPVLPAFAKGGAVWAWDGAWLSALADQGTNLDAICTDVGRLKAAGDLSFVIAAPDQPTPIDRALTRLWEDLAELQHHPGGASHEAVRWMWGAFGALSQLAVPVDTYDRHARVAWKTTTLSEAPAKARAFSRNALSTEDREYWEVLALDLEDALNAATQSNPKPAALVKWVRERIEAVEGGVIVVRNVAAREGVAEYLQSRPDVPFGWQDGVRIVTVSEVLGGKTDLGYGHALAVGPVAVDNGVLFAVPSALTMTILGHGPWEAGRIVRQVASVRRSLVGLAHGPTRLEASHRLFGTGVHGREVTPIPLRITHSVLTLPPLSQTATDAVWDPFDVNVVKDLGRQDTETEGPAREAPTGPEYVVAALRIGFADGHGYFEPDQLVSKVAGADVKFEVAIKALKIGDRVLLVDHGARRGLFDVIAEKLESLPEFAGVVMLIRDWQERARRAGYESGLTHAQILSRMGAQAGVTTPAAVGHWVRGFVFGPDDPEDVRRFGEAVGDQFLAQRWQAIGRALETMRTQRRKWGKMLARVVSGLNPAELDDAGYFDRRLGIHYSDLAETVTMHEVKAVSDSLQPVPYAFANRLLSGNDAAILP